MHSGMCLVDNLTSKESIFYICNTRLDTAAVCVVCQCTEFTCDNNNFTQAWQAVKYLSSLQMKIEWYYD